MKKWIAMVLAVIACLGVFTACNKGGDEKGEEKPAENAVIEEKEETPVVAEPVVGEDLEEVKEQIAGMWISNDGSTDMSIYFAGEECRVDIDRRQEEYNEYWHFTGDVAKVDGYRVMGVECEKYVCRVETNFTQESVYENGVSTIVLKDGVITWYDAEEDAGKGLTFTKVEETQ